MDQSIIDRGKIGECPVNRVNITPILGRQIQLAIPNGGAIKGAMGLGTSIGSTEGQPKRSGFFYFKPFKAHSTPVLAKAVHGRTNKMM